MFFLENAMTTNNDQIKHVLIKYDGENLDFELQIDNV